ncbi:hypothetical protein L9F63_004897, partial [Diploptera punctata]
ISLTSQGLLPLVQDVRPSKAFALAGCECTGVRSRREAAILWHLFKTWEDNFNIDYGFALFCGNVQNFFVVTEIESEDIFKDCNKVYIGKTNQTQFAGEDVGKNIYIDEWSLEDEFWKKDGLMEDVMDSFITSLGGMDPSEEEDNSENGRYRVDKEGSDHADDSLCVLTSLTLLTYE